MPKKSEMTIEKANEIIKSISYKPWIDFFFEGDIWRGCDDVTLNVHAWVPNVDQEYRFDWKSATKNAANTLEVMEHRTLIRIRSEHRIYGEHFKKLGRDDIVHLVESQFRSLESHEFDEWFKINGKAPRDPHKKQ